MRQKKRDIGIIARVPLASGLLSRESKAKTGPYTTSDAVLKMAKSQSDQYLFLTQDNKRTLAQAAIQFILQYPEVATVIPGAFLKQQLQELLDYQTAPALTADEKNKF